MTRKILALFPLILIPLFILIFYVSGAYHWLHFQTIQQEHLKWKTFVDLHPLLSAICYIGIYITSVLLIIPDSMILTILGGFLFPLPLAFAYACLSETIGATLFFLMIRVALGEALSKKKKHQWSEMEAKFQADEAYYLLFLRFSHLLPFWIINLLAGIFRVRIWTFIWTTAVGVVPLTYFLAASGTHFSLYFETHTHFIFKEIFTPAFKITLVALGGLALLPIAYKKFKSKFKKKAP